MKYISTRNKEISIASSQAIIQGISRDGGLFLPDELPKIPLENLKDLDYKRMAFEILRVF